MAAPPPPSGLEGRKLRMRKLTDAVPPKSRKGSLLQKVKISLCLLVHNRIYNSVATIVLQGWMSVRPPFFHDGITFERFRASPGGASFESLTLYCCLTRPPRKTIVLNSDYKFRLLGKRYDCKVVFVFVHDGI